MQGIRKESAPASEKERRKIASKIFFAIDFFGNAFI
jgi:hypothetical protein